MPEHLNTEVYAHQFAEPPTDENRRLVLDAVRDCPGLSSRVPADIATIGGGWGEVLEYLQDAGTPVPLAQMMGALKGL